jgi:hypothetical protein
MLTTAYEFHKRMTYKRIFEIKSFLKKLKIAKKE